MNKEPTEPTQPNTREADRMLLLGAGATALDLLAITCDFVTRQADHTLAFATAIGTDLILSATVVAGASYLARRGNGQGFSQLARRARQHIGSASQSEKNESK